MTDSCRIANSLNELRTYLTEVIDESGFEARRIPLDQQADWVYQEGVLSHRSKGFFHIAGLNSPEGQHLVLYQPQSALTGLCLYRDREEVYVLVQARIEPGNSGVGQYGPSIQATQANMLRVHQGESPSYVSLFTSADARVHPLGSIHHHDLGKRYFQKTKAHSYVEARDWLPTSPAFVWASLNSLHDACAQSYLINTDLRSLLSVFDWDSFSRNEAVSRPTHQIWKGTATSMLGANLAEIIPLSDLNNWRRTEYGYAPISGSASDAIGFNMYNVYCTSREIHSWRQPLIYAEGQGRVVLATRQRADNDDSKDYLISIEQEFGISGRGVVMPTHVLYPGEKNSNCFEGGQSRILHQSEQSEEGGRFEKNVSSYEIIEVEHDFPVQGNQRWVTGPELLAILQQACGAGIQLRCICSMILDDLNPLSLSR